MSQIDFTHVALVFRLPIISKPEINPPLKWIKLSQDSDLVKGQITA